MRGLAAAAMLAAWERASAVPDALRPAALLDEVRAGENATAADLPLGARDAGLLEWYAVTFGDALDVFGTCPSCATAVELTLSCADLRDRASGVPVQPLKVDRYVVDWRLPTTADLAALDGCRTAGDAGTALLCRCVLLAELDGVPVDAGDMPAAVREAVGAAMAEADPLAEILLDLDCPECTSRWTSRLDVASFAWRRLDAGAQRLLGDVHLLAHAYGWSESEILALSPIRRATYLRLVGDG
jgi:hypothetical protein